MKETDATFPMSVTLFSNHLKSNPSNSQSGKLKFRQIFGWVFQDFPIRVKRKFHFMFHSKDVSLFKFSLFEMTSQSELTFSFSTPLFLFFPFFNFIFFFNFLFFSFSFFQFYFRRNKFLIFELKFLWPRESTHLKIDSRLSTVWHRFSTWS